ncbi:MAG: shikimate kinase [Aquificaceae bacterium]|nr:shikimate kinase [Aquificaceae bacterium]MCS7196665.1 shikimate kinase [Aquificaceae bacterium]MDW8032141.1 shikimate kinase [Aquificaceae bacterium]MDW8293962.1 shikimate kinase [Aquificaceae bacterium]
MNCKRVYLVGFMCSGKSTLGRLLSERTRWSFVDLDEELERVEGMSIVEIFDKKGEDFFRRRELEMLKDLSRREGVIISTGGGLGANPTAMDFMKSMGLVVWLKVGFDTFLQRCGKDPSRPLLKRSREELLRLFEERSEVYQRAHITLEASSKPEILMENLLANLKTLSYNGEEGG